MLSRTGPLSLSCCGIDDNHILILSIEIGHFSECPRFIIPGYLSISCPSNCTFAAQRENFHTTVDVVGVRMLLLFFGFG